MKPRAVIFDIDGTLAKRVTDRSPFDWARVGEDELVAEIAELLIIFQDSEFSILLFSGRDSSCRKITETWLEDHNVFYDELHMRSEGDNRKDVIVKEEFYNDCINRFDIIYAVDDRPQVCRKWHELGLCLLKVGDPDLEF